MRSTFTKAEGECLRRQAGLSRTLGSPGKEKPPRFPVKSLSDEDLAKELRTAPDGPWLDAVITEAQARGETL